MKVNQCELSYDCNMAKMKECKYYQVDAEQKGNYNCVYRYNRYCSYFPAQVEAYKEEKDEMEFALNQHD